MEKKETMERKEKGIKQVSQAGSIRIADEVISVIAGLAATEVKGVAGMSGGIAGGIAERLGRKDLTRGIKVEVGEKEAAIHIYILVDFGVRIPDVASRIQESVKNAVENMAGLQVKEVNLHVQGVVFPQEEKSSEEDTHDSLKKKAD